MKTVIQNCKKNIMGTVSFDGHFEGMRKPQDFIVYPMQDSGECINIQSDTRWGNIDLATGRGLLSAPRAQYANRLWFTLCYAQGRVSKIELSAEDLQTLRGWIKSTGGLLVGSSFVRCDNTGALAL